MPETTGPATAGEHMAEARRLAARAEERESHWDRSVDLQAAQVHATLAQTLTAETMMPAMAKLAAWLADSEAAPKESAAQPAQPGRTETTDD